MPITNYADPNDPGAYLDDYVNQIYTNQPNQLNKGPAESATLNPEQAALADLFPHPINSINEVPQITNTAAIPSPSGSNSSSAGQSVSTSRSAINPQTLKSMTGDRTIDKRVDARMGQVVGNAQETANDYNQVADEKRNAAGMQEKAEVGLADTETQNLLDQQELSEKMTAVEVEERGKSVAREELAMQNHAAAVAEYEAMTVNPGQLWDNASGGSKFGMLLSVATAGFLKSQGVDTEVMNTLNTAIQRNIDGQLANIDKKGKSVDQFKQMWEMTRAQSMSDAEARDKMRSFMLSDLKLGGAAKLSAFGNDLAKAKAAQWVAGISDEQAQNAERIRGNIQNQSNAIYGQEVDRRRGEIAASMESRRISITERAAKAEAEAARVAAGKKAVEDLNSNILVDTSPSAHPDGKQNMWKFNPGLQNSKKEQIQTAVNDIAAMNNMVEEYRDLARKNGTGYEGPQANALRNRDRARAEQLRTLITTEMKRKDSGLAASDSEQKMYNNLVSADSWTKGLLGTKQTEALASQIQQINKLKTNTQIGGFTSPVTDEERQNIRPRTQVNRNQIGGDAEFNPNDFDATSGLSATEGIANKKPEVSEVARLVSKAEDAESGEVVEEPTDFQKEDWQHYNKLVGNIPLDGSDPKPSRRFAVYGDLYSRAKGGDAEAIDALKKASEQTQGTDRSSNLADTFFPDKLTPQASQAEYYLVKLQADGVDIPGLFEPVEGQTAQEAAKSFLVIPDSYYDDYAGYRGPDAAAKLKNKDRKPKSTITDPYADSYINER